MVWPLLLHCVGVAWVVYLDCLHLRLMTASHLRSPCSAGLLSEHLQLFFTRHRYIICGVSVQEPNRPFFCVDTVCWRGWCLSGLSNGRFRVGGCQNGALVCGFGWTSRYSTCNLSPAISHECTFCDSGVSVFGAFIDKHGGGG
jgi:hypothetical protein